MNERREHLTPLQNQQEFTTTRMQLYGSVEPPPHVCLLASEHHVFCHSALNRINSCPMLLCVCDEASLTSSLSQKPCVTIRLSPRNKNTIFFRDPDTILGLNNIHMVLLSGYGQGLCSLLCRFYAGFMHVFGWRHHPRPSLILWIVSSINQNPNGFHF